MTPSPKAEQGTGHKTGDSTCTCGKRVEATWDSTGGPETEMGWVLGSQVFLMPQDMATMKRDLGYDRRSDCGESEALDMMTDVAL